VLFSFLSKQKMIKLHKTQEWNWKQPKAEFAPRCPVRALVVAPSFSGKSCLLVSCILDVYRNCWERVIIFSKTVFVDPVWRPVMQWQEREKKPDEKERLYFDDFGDDDIMKVVKKQAKVIEICKEKGYRTLPQICIILDDCCDDPAFRNYHSINLLATRGRHYGINLWVSVQKMRTCHPLLRVNVTCVICFALRNAKELEALIEEYSGRIGRDNMIAIYNEAIKDAHNFLMINLMEHDPSRMFYKNFTARLVPEIASDLHPS
jgi:hypothetical protein